MQFFERNRFWVLLYVFAVCLGCLAVYLPKNQAIADADDQLDTTTQNLSQYQVLIGQHVQLVAQYRLLGQKYIVNRPDQAHLESSFTRLIADEAKRHDVQFYGAHFGDVNGSAPPAPTPNLDKDGNPVAATPMPQGTTSQAAAIKNLGGKFPGDPSVDRPDISPMLFTRIPVSMTFQGKWRDMIGLYQDLPRENVLMITHDPQINNNAGNGIVTGTMQVELLIPAVDKINSVLAGATLKRGNHAIRVGPVKGSGRAHFVHHVPVGLSTLGSVPTVTHNSNRVAERPVTRNARPTHVTPTLQRMHP